MALFDPIEKLITEHGSAAILRDHVALFKDQLAILKDKFATLQTENEALKAENQNLKAENKQLIKKIQVHDQPSHDKLLDKSQIFILIFLSQQQKSVQTSHIAQSVNMAQQIAKFHLEELKRKKLIKHSIGLQGINRGNDIWSLAHEGRRYLINHRLIS
jgi:DNA-binding MarR family transcriptional regulator